MCLFAPSRPNSEGFRINEPASILPLLAAREEFADRTWDAGPMIAGSSASTGKIREVRVDRLPLHLIRNLSHFTGQNLWFYSLTLITLAQVFALEFTTPLWVIVLSPLLLGERLTSMRVLASSSD